MRSVPFRLRLPSLSLPRFSQVRARLALLPARWRALLFLLAGVLLGVLVTLGVLVLPRPALVLGQDAVTTPESRRARVTLQDDGGHFINILPASGQADTLLIFYPGGRVRPQSYEWLGRALAADGVQTVIPVFPMDLAVLGVNRADHLIDRYGKRKVIVLAGHSLGGAMAAQFAAKKSNRLDALILEAAYPARNTTLRGTNLRVLSLLAERDGVAAPVQVRDGLKRLPPGTSLVTIPGAVHSFFGRYGPQRGDGLPTVSRAEAEMQIVQAVRAFLKESAALRSTP